MSQLKWIETQRLILNDLKHEDTEAIFSIFSNDAVLEFYDVKKFTTLENAYALIERIQQKFENQQGYRYAIRLKNEKDLQQFSETLIGSFGVNRILDVDGQYGAVIGYDLHPNFWQKGYMSEVLSQILLELKDDLLFSKKISFVIAEVYAGNDKSMRLLLKHGFHQVESNVDEQIRLNLEITSRKIFKLNFESII